MKKTNTPARKAPIAAPKRPAAKAAAQKTIMIVDDEGDIRTSVKSILEREGYKTILAVDGDDCLRKLKQQKPDLILLDIMMPGRPVKEVIQQVKGTKIMFLSVVRTSEAEREALLKEPNIMEFIQKPFDIKELVAKVRQATR